MTGLRISRQRLGAVIFLLLSLFYGAQIGDIQQLPVDKYEVMNARSMPWFLFASGVFGSVLLWVLAAPIDAAPIDAAQIDQPAEPGRLANFSVAAGLLLWTFAFAWLIKAAGVVLAIAAFLVGGFLMLGERRAGVVCAVAFGTAVALWLILHKGFGLYFSPGTLWAFGVDAMRDLICV